MALAHGRSHPVHGFAVGHVAHLVLAADLLGCHPQPILTPSDEDAPPTALGEPACESRSDPGRAAGDDGYLHTRTIREATARRPRVGTTTACKRCLPFLAFAECQRSE
jgi:hypothetical protein